MDTHEKLAKAFTVESTGLMLQVITDCGICKSFNPNLNPNINSHPEVKFYKGLWDTGASGTVINKKVVDELGLIPTGMAQSFNANGSAIVNTYLVNVLLPNNVGLHTVTVTEGILQDIDVLIGMNIISKGDFCISNFEGKTVCTFQIPSTKRTDYVQENNKKSTIHIPIVNNKKIGRNDPCMCGSGKKYKNCCLK